MASGAQRKEIRHAVVALLVAASTAAGDRVNPTRIEPHRASQLPAIGVYTLNDPVDGDKSTHTEDAHSVELEIVAWVGHIDTYPVDDAMDDIAEQIENAMVADPYLGKSATKVTFLGTVCEVVESDGRSDPTVGIAVLRYSVEYFSSASPPANLVDFLSAKVTTAVTGGVSDTAPAEDIFTVQEP